MHVALIGSKIQKEVVGHTLCQHPSAVSLLLADATKDCLPKKKAKFETNRPEFKKVSFSLFESRFRGLPLIWSVSLSHFDVT